MRNRVEKYSLAYLTTAPMQAPEMIQLARDVGFETIGARLTSTAPNEPSALLEDASLQRATISCIKATGVGILDVEVLRIDPDFEVKEHKRLFEVAAMLGAAVVLAIGDDPDELRLRDRFGELCELAAPYHLDVQLEFMPWTAVPDARTALRIVSSIGKSNAKILVDTLHVARSQTTLDDLSAIPADMIKSVQICDGNNCGVMSPEAMMQSARYGRLLPGEGDVDIPGILSRLPNGLRIGVEVPNSIRLAELGPKSWAERALVASKLVVERVGQSIELHDDLNREGEK